MSQLTACCISLLVLLLNATAADAKPRPPKAVNSSVFERGLVKNDISWRDVTRAHNLYHEATHEKRFEGPVLAYVTPWNGRGYEVAKTFRGKLTHVCPVWYQLRSSGGGSYHLTGGHDVDAGWLAALHSRDAPGKPPLVVPRVLLELPPEETAGSLLDGAPAVAALLAAEARQHGFDGWARPVLQARIAAAHARSIDRWLLRTLQVLEAWSQWASLGLAHSQPLRRRAHAFVRQLGAKLKASHLELILAVPPALPAHPHGPAFTTADWAALKGHITSVSLMTYDHAVAGPGPNAPLPWVAANLHALAAGINDGGEAGSLLVGLNFYGMDWALGDRPAAEPLLGRQAAELLRRHRPRLQWQAEAAEHSFEYVTNGRGHRVFYPTLASIQARLQLAAGQGAGIALWEIGQGMECFMDLL